MITLKNFKKKAILIGVACMFVTSVFGQNYRAKVHGFVKDNKGEAVIGAIVEAKNESTGFSASTTTNDNGDYIIGQLPLGSPYSITVKYIGFGDQTKKGYSLNQGDDQRVDFNLKESNVLLETINVVASSLKSTSAMDGAATSVTTNDLNKLPVKGRNFSSLIALSPLSTGTSLAGQLSTSTNFIIDGMTAKGPTSGGSTTSRNDVPYAISMEAIREFKVVTNEYDVSNGRAGGGTISTVTKQGTNTFKGDAFISLQSDWLSSPYDIRGNKRDNKFSTYQYGGSIGGAIIKNRLHYFFAWDHQSDIRPLYIADIKSKADESRYNITQNTLDRYLDIARKKYGVSNHAQFGSFDKKQGTDAIFGRLDWQINATNLLSFTDNFINDQNNMGLNDNSAINLYEVYGNVHSLNNSAMLTLRSVFGPNSTNELKFQHLYTLEQSKPGDELPNTNIPRAIVQRVASTIDGKSTMTTIQLGGQRYCPENFYNNVYQLADNFYYNTNHADYTFGIDMMCTHMNSRYGSETNGRFYFNGLDNFENLNPYRYVREIYLNPSQRVKQNIMNTGLYAQMQTKLFNGFSLMAGLRLDEAIYFNKGNFSPLVYKELGLRTDNGMSTFILQPRVQAIWDINDQHKDIIKWGAGIFASDINNYAMINNMVFDGTKVMSLDVQNTSTNENIVPIPDFPSYRQNPLSSPGVDLLKDSRYASLAVPTINMNDKDCKVPTIYKTNITYTHYFNDRLRVGISGYVTLGRNNYMYIDKNMVDKPYFRLANEDNRGVYVPAETITKSGVNNWMDGRKSQKIGRVLDMVSDGKVNQFAIIMDATWRYFRDGQLSVSYTWNDTKDNTTYTGNVANSATLSQMVIDDPRDLSHMSYSNNQFRHKIVAYGTAPTFWGITIGARFSGIAGTRYSMISSGNVNGDFVSTNDLAYVFDPNDSKTPKNIADGINALLNNPDVESSFKNYLRRSFGKVAERNGGVNGFYGTLDLHVDKKIKLYRRNNLQCSVDIFNVANFINKKWGVGHDLSNTALDAITGFDKNSKEYSYLVLPNAGISRKNGSPYQIQIGLKYNF
jgi:hypothetical protein